MRAMLVVAMLAGGLAASHANGPAWVAELSAIDPPARDTLEVTLPVGTHVTIGVFNTDAVAPEPPEGVAATVRVLWYEHRTVFHGLPEERNVAIPYYLPPLGQATPNGSFAVELEPSETGTFVVPMKCNSNTVTVTLNVIDLPPSDIGYGFYTERSRYADWTKSREYLADQARHGMNTLAAYTRELPPAWGVDNRNHARLLAWELDAAAEAGLLDVRFPVLVLSIDPVNIPKAHEYQKHEWPELVMYNRDEPPLSAAQVVIDHAAAARAVGLRNGTAIHGPWAQAIGDPIDIWVLHMDSVSESVIGSAHHRGKERWVYNCYTRGSNAPLHRYWTGLYAWATGPKVVLHWAYMHFKESRINPDGTWNLLRVHAVSVADKDGLPLPTVALKGMSDGIIDSRLLQELERRDTPEGNAYLAGLRAQVPLDFWPGGQARDYNSGGPGYYVWDVPDVTTPPVDMVKMREELVRLLGGAGND